MLFFTPFQGLVIEEPELSHFLGAKPVSSLCHGSYENITVACKMVAITGPSFGALKWGEIFFFISSTLKNARD